MARLNIEDSLVNDERFIFVSSKIGRYQAMGQFVFIAKLAQRYWIDGMLIPESVYNLGEFSDAFFSSGLVEKRENGVYLRGSEEHFAWILSKRENGQKGGRPRKSNDLRKANETESKANESYENPLTLSPALSLSLTQIKEEKKIKEKSKKNVFCFEEVWSMYPEKSGKKQAEKHFNQTVKTPDDFESLKIAIKNYLQSPKPMAGFIKNGSTFFNDWRPWVDPTPQMMINNAKNANSMLYMANPYETKGEEK